MDKSGEQTTGRQKQRQVPRAVPPRISQHLLGHQTPSTTQLSRDLIFPGPRTKTHFHGFFKEILEILCASRF